MSTQETRASARELVRSRHPQADAVFQKPIHALGQPTPISEGGWVVFSAPTLGAQVLGRGATEDEAWSDAASAARPGAKRPSLGFRDWLAAQASDPAAEEARRGDIEAWRGDVSELCSQIKQWLAEEDALSVLKVDVGEVEIHEEGWPPYSVAVMRIGLAPGRFVHLRPIGRNVVGSIGGFGREGFRSEGRVDMSGAFGRFELHRAFSDASRFWLMVDDGGGVRAWNKENFQAALQDLFS
ncbi:hypothetical protein [Paludisphaera sp.]|uniref:hypothetical protein n=1 Tax=Paludisphaera sp. TaxID=2017432 RepID=UPI00301C0FD8